MSGGSVVVFPDHYPEAHPLRDSRIKLYGSFDLNVLRKETGCKEVREEGELEIFTIRSEGFVYALGLRGFHIYRPMKEATSPGSGAFYVARSEDEMEGLLLQLLLPNSNTSRHFHEVKRELFHPIAGAGGLIVNGKGMILMRDAQIIEPGMIHQVRTLGLPLLTLLQVVGDPKGLSMEDHIYVP